MVMIPTDYQNAICEIGYPILAKHGLVYLAMQERTGKSISGLLMCERAPTRNRWLIASTVQGLYGIEPKVKMGGWTETLAECDEWLTKEYKTTTYHQIKKHLGWAEGVILDEAHFYLSPFPPIDKKMWLETKVICAGLPVIFMSATADSQGMSQRFSQLACSSFSPWARYRGRAYGAYNWYRDYGARDNSGRLYRVRRSADEYANDYTKINRDKVIRDSDHLFITKTRAELGFEHEPEDVLHYIELDDNTKQAYNKLNDKKVLAFTANGKDYQLALDTTMRIRASQQMIEGGVLKVGDEYVVLSNTEKIDYILDTWGDTEDLVIMYNYKAEGTKLRQHFKRASILQGSSNAQGIDLSHIEHLVVYSQNFSTAQYSQRRSRQANMNRKTAIKVHFLLVKNALSAQVYKQVAINKVNFIDALFERNKL